MRPTWVVHRIPCTPNSSGVIRHGDEDHDVAQVEHNKSQLTTEFSRLVFPFPTQMVKDT